MPPQTERLDREALLMLYASDELSGEERAAFDQKLAGDENLRAELDRLREAVGRTSGAIDLLDQRQRPPVSEGVALRRVMRAINQWLLTRVQKRPAARQRLLPIAWWAYPTAAAAAVIVGFLVWSSTQEIGPLPADPQVRANIQLAEADADALADRLESEFDISADARADDAMRRELPGPADTFFMAPAEENAQ